MRSLSALQQELEALEMLARSDREKPYIPFPADFMLDTATIKGKVYHRKRPRLADGRAGKPEYISSEHYAELKDALARGRSLHQLERDIEKLVARIDRLSNAIEQRKQQATKKLEAQIDRLVGGVEAVKQGTKVRNLAGNDVSIFLFQFELHGAGIDFILNEGIADDMYQDLDEQLKPLVHTCCETLSRYRPLSLSNIIMDGNILLSGEFEVMLSKGLGQHFRPQEKARLFQDAKQIADLLTMVMDRRTQAEKAGIPRQPPAIDHSPPTGTSGRI